MDRETNPTPKDMIPLRFSDGQWRPVAESKERVPSPPTSSFSLATMNVLADCFPFFVEWAILSPVRFAALVKEVETLDATILCMNEVTTTSLKALLDSDFVRKNYYVSECPCALMGELGAETMRQRGNVIGTANGDESDSEKATAAATGQPAKKQAKKWQNSLVFNTSLGFAHGNVIFSKIPFHSLRSLSLRNLSPSGVNKRPAVVGTFEIASNSSTPKLFSVCAVHTTAHQTPTDRALREKELDRCSAFCRQLGASQVGEANVTTKNTNSAFVILGDLNLHYLNEDRFVQDNDLLDLWVETHVERDENALAQPRTEADPSDLRKLDDPGWTFDPPSNSMIKRYIPGEARSMRLDRILVSRGCAFLSAMSKTRIWGNKAVDKKRDVFLSDHYGLVQEFRVVDAGDDKAKTTDAAALGDGNEDARSYLQQTAKAKDETYMQSWTWYAVFGWSLGWHFPWLAARGVGAV